MLNEELIILKKKNSWDIEEMHKARFREFWSNFELQNIAIVKYQVDSLLLRLSM